MSNKGYVFTIGIIFLLGVLISFSYFYQKQNIFNTDYYDKVYFINNDIKYDLFNYFGNYFYFDKNTFFKDCFRNLDYNQNFYLFYKTDYSYYNNLNLDLNKETNYNKIYFDSDYFVHDFSFPENSYLTLNKINHLDVNLKLDYDINQIFWWSFDSNGLYIRINFYDTSGYFATREGYIDKNTVCGDDDLKIQLKDGSYIYVQVCDNFFKIKNYSNRDLNVEYKLPLFFKIYYDLNINYKLANISYFGPVYVR